LKNLIGIACLGLVVLLPLSLLRRKLPALLIFYEHAIEIRTSNRKTLINHAVGIKPCEKKGREREKTKYR